MDDVSVKAGQNPIPRVQQASGTDATAPPRLESSLERPDVCPEDQRSLKAAIIGLSNTGKSTLVNLFLGLKVITGHTHYKLHVDVATPINNRLVSYIRYLQCPPRGTQPYIGLWGSSLRGTHK